MFQSTPLREGRHRVNLIMQSITCFNPRPCARGDIYRVPGVYDIQSFNPRPCARGDGQLISDEQGYDVSIHAPARGATFTLLLNNFIAMFQSTPLREGRLIAVL